MRRLTVNSTSTVTKSILACSQTLYILVFEIVERAYENKNSGGFNDSQRKRVGKRSRSRAPGARLVRWLIFEKKDKTTSVYGLYRYSSLV